MRALCNVKLNMSILVESTQVSTSLFTSTNSTTRHLVTIRQGPHSNVQNDRIGHDNSWINVTEGLISMPTTANKNSNDNADSYSSLIINFHQLCTQNQM